MLQALRDTPDRAQQELALQMALGPTRLATKGQAAPEVGHTFNRARELCQQVGEASQLFLVVHGLMSFHFVRAEYQRAHELAEQLLSLAQRLQDAVYLVEAHLVIRLWQGQGKRTAAHELLAPVYGWFTEGFDTADLQEAKALLTRCSHPAR